MNLEAFVRSLSDLELVKLQHEARAVDDGPLLRIVLAELQRRARGSK